MLNKKKHIRGEQSGITAIMFAMFLVIVISLLAIGFATLVRKDQQATLDKTLSYQAQYAAESGVNKITSYIDTSPAPKTRTNCNDPIIGDDNAPASSFKVGEADITCATWTSELDHMVLEPSSTNPKFGSFKGVMQIKVSWQSDSYGTAEGVIPTSLESDKPVLGIAISEKSDFNKVKRFYLVPRNSNGCGNESYTNDNSGAVFCAKVDDDGTANVTIKGFSRNTEYSININPINGSNTVPITVARGGGNGNFKNTSQYKIDVNARAQDITKRVVVYYNASGTPARPYVVNIPTGGTFCKDYKVDGNQNATVSGGRTACPN